MRQTTEHQVVAEDGLRLNLVDFGGDSDTPLLFLHGSFGHARVWDFVVEALGRYQRAFALDFPGHGASEHSPELQRYRFDWLIRDVRAAVDSLPSSPVVVGHSIGSGVAMHYAARHPDTISGAVFMDIDPWPPEYQVQHLHEAGAQPPKEYDDFERAVARESRVAPGASEAVHRHLATHGYVERDGVWHQRFDQRFLVAVERWDAREELRNVTVPALVLRGAESAVMSPESMDMMLERLPRRRSVAIQKAGHQLHLERPVEVARAIAAFVAELKTSP